MRIDSGDEYEIADKAIKSYQKLGIDPTQKTLIFSNSLDFPKALAIQQYCGDRIKTSFGIGGNLVNGGWIRNRAAGKSVYIPGKGKNKPLYDTGALYEAFDYEIEEE